MLKAIVLAALLAAASAYNFTTHYFEQDLDHFGFRNQTKFSQRYLLAKQYYKPGGPIFLYTGGFCTANPEPHP